MRKKFLAAVVAAAIGTACSASFAGERIALASHGEEGGMPIVEALELRRSSRDFVDCDLTILELSALAWAAAGINREGGGRVFPTTLGRQDMTAYIFTREGAYRYIPETDELELAARGDHRAITGMQPFAADAAANIVYVQDRSLWGDVPAEMAAIFGGIHAGAMSQNVYLYAASRGWGAVVRGSFDGAALTKLLGLGDEQAIVLAQSVGPAASIAPRGRLLGGLSPDDAHRYMTRTERLLIVDVRPARYRMSGGFFGSIVIAASEVGTEAADEMLMSLPSDRPIIIHCGNGVAAKKAYDRLISLRSDIRELSYIDGRPLFEEYQHMLDGYPRGDR